MPPTPPKDSATPTSSMTGTQSALGQVDQLDNCVHDLKRELRSYGDANSVGRDVQQLRDYFTRIQRFTQEIARATGIDWQPNSS